MIFFPLKEINLVMFDIDNHEKGILEVGLQKQNHWNYIQMESNKSFRHAISARD